MNGHHMNIRPFKILLTDGMGYINDLNRSCANFEVKKVDYQRRKEKEKPRKTKHWIGHDQFIKEIGNLEQCSHWRKVHQNPMP